MIDLKRILVIKVVSPSQFSSLQLSSKIILTNNKKIVKGEEDPNFFERKKE